ncbi:MAG: hypothetical protein K2K70_06215 [Lachnospiraceae bacterium]|nr:hypothetical protein [Lachnospiraceae bacterium]
MTSIEELAFEGCSRLTSVTWNGTLIQASLHF